MAGMSPSSNPAARKPGRDLPGRRLRGVRRGLTRAPADSRRRLGRAWPARHVSPTDDV